MTVKNFSQLTLLTTYDKKSAKKLLRWLPKWKNVKILRTYVTVNISDSKRSLSRIKAKYKINSIKIKGNLAYLYMDISEIKQFLSKVRTSKPISLRVLCFTTITERALIKKHFGSKVLIRY